MWPRDRRDAVRKGGWRSVLRTAGLWIAVGCLSGCATGLPAVRTDWLHTETLAIPAGVAPVHSWRASRSGLKTFWGEQTVTIRAKGYLPPGRSQPGDGLWEVTAANHEGKAIPFLGCLRSFVNENGTEVAEVLPRFDLDEAPDGLYVVLVPGIEAKDGTVASVRPHVLLREIRDHSWKPFSVRIPLIPEKESPLTPRPQGEDTPEPAGTPIPMPSS